MNKTVVAVNRLYPHKQLTIIMTMEAARVEAIMTLKANVIMVMAMEDMMTVEAVKTREANLLMMMAMEEMVTVEELMGLA